MDTRKVLISNQAQKLVDTLREKFGPLIFHQSGGCCDGSSPMCFERDDFLIGDSDILLGEVHGCNFYMAKDQYEYWKYSQLTIDITEGRGASFSLEIPYGYRFIIKSRLFTDQEWEAISADAEAS